MAKMYGRMGCAVSGLAHERAAQAAVAKASANAKADLRLVLAHALWNGRRRGEWAGLGLQGIAPKRKGCNVRRGAGGGK